MKVFVAIVLCLGLAAGSPLDFIQEHDASAMRDLNERDGIPRDGYALDMSINGNAMEDLPPISDNNDLEDTPMRALNAEDIFPYSNCRDVMNAGYKTNGTYLLTLNETKLMVSCGFNQGYAFTIFLNRVDARVSWDVSIHSYIRGFGFPLHDYFSGLYNLYLLTNRGTVGLLVQFSDWHGREMYSSYTRFRVGAPSTGYRLYLKGIHRGNIPNDMHFNNEQPFRTSSNDNHFNCAHNLNAGWWFVNAAYCTATLPTGHYYTGPTFNTNGIFWYHYSHTYKYSMKKFTMSIAHY